MDDEQKKDADLQSDEQSTDLEVKITPDENQDDDSQAPDKEDPSDKMTPEHPRFKQVLQEKKDLEEEKEQLQRELEEARTKSETTDDDGLTEEERISLEKIEKNLTKRGFVRQDDLRVTQNAENLRKLSEKYDGKNDLPAFDRTEVVTFAKKNGFGDNYEAAYREMHFDAIVEVNAKKVAAAPKAPDTEKPTSGGEQTVTKRFSREDINKMSDADYEKYRTGLLTAIKPK